MTEAIHSDATGHPSERIATDRLTSIDALRGLAALTVVVYHARGLFWVGLRQLWSAHGLTLSPAILLGYLSFPLTFGFLGVQLFFVLSGYCIHRRGARMLAEDPEAKLPLRAFYMRRLKRIYPTYVAALLLTFGFDWLSLHVFGDSSISRLDHSPFAMAMNLLSLQGFFSSPYGSNGVLWTLSIEMHLYLLYPLLFAATRRFGAAVTLGTTLVVSSAYILLADITGFERLAFPHAAGAGGPLFIPFWFTWTMGFFIADAEAGRARVPRALLWAGIPSLALGLGTWTLGHARAAEPLFAIGMGALVYAALSRRCTHAAGKIAVRTLAGIGLFSYSLYAVHLPCLRLLRAAVLPQPSHHLLMALVASLFAVAAAWLVFQFVERRTLSSHKS